MQHAKPQHVSGRVCAGNAEQLQQLLGEADVDVDQADEEGRTALHFAGELLMDSGPSIFFETTAQGAVQYGHSSGSVVFGEGVRCDATQGSRGLQCQSRGWVVCLCSWNAAHCVSMVAGSAGCIGC
jgi:hypothetical protein